MGRTPRDVTDAELGVLRVLWRRGACAMRQVADELYPGGGASEFATVQKLCERLRGKALVVVDRTRRPHQYSAAIDEASLIDRKLQAVADEFCEGAPAPLISRLLRSGGVTPEQMRQLKDDVESFLRDAGDDAEGVS